MLRLSPDAIRTALRMLVISALAWFVLCVALGLAGAAGTAAVLRVGDGDSSMARFVAHAETAARFTPLTGFLTSTAMRETRAACIATRPVLEPLAAVCLAADVGASSADAVALGARTYLDLGPSSLLRERGVSLDAVQRLTKALEPVRSDVRDAELLVARTLDEPRAFPRWRGTLQELDATLMRLDAALSLAPALPELLGTTRTTRFFVGLTSQAETRAGGGLLGMFARLDVTKGEFTVRGVGSYREPRAAGPLPAGLDPGFYGLFGTSNPEWQNLNVSPNAPDAGRAWVAATKAETGERMDGAISLDTLALGRLCAAAGITLRESSGRILTTADEITDYASYGVYDDFPGDDLARKRYQQQVVEQLLTRLFAGGADSARLLEALLQSIGDGHAWVFASRPLLQQQLITAGAAGDITQGQSDAVQLRFNNLSGNKADFFLQPTVSSRQDDGSTTIDVRLAMSKRLGVATAPIVTNRLDALQYPGLGSRLQLLWVLGSSLQSPTLRVYGRVVPAQVVPYGSATVLAYAVDVTLGRPVELQLRVRGLADTERLLAGALVHS